MVLNGVAILLGQTLLIASKSHLSGDRSSNPPIFSVPWLLEEGSRASQDYLSQTKEDSNGKCFNPREIGRTDLLQSKQMLLKKVVVHFIHTVTKESVSQISLWFMAMRSDWPECSASQNRICLHSINKMLGTNILIKSFELPDLYKLKVFPRMP